MKTYVPKMGEVQRAWYVVDATGQTLGRLAVRIATVLRGKHKAQFTPSMDVGDFVIVVNAAKVELTGRKRQQKIYYHHTGYMGGLKEIPFERMVATHPERIIRFAVEGMLPRNRIGRALLKKLKIYAGPDHPHQAQNPQPLEV